MDAESDGRFITFRCTCGQHMKVPVEKAGAKGSCRACGRRIVVPRPPPPLGRGGAAAPPDHWASPHHRPDIEGPYSEEDLVTYPDELPVRESPTEPEEDPDAEKSLFELRGEILKYPVASKLGTQIFLSGAILFSPIVWKAVTLAGYVPCCLMIFVQLFIVLCILSIWLMYFSYLLLVIEKSAQGSKRIPELPVFTSWQDNFKDLLKVLGVSVIAFSPFLVYTVSINIQVLAKMEEAQARNEVPGEEIFSGISTGLGMQVLLYAVAAFYMPMVLMALVVTKSFARAVNPVFIFRSIWRIRREYLTAMIIIFIFLRGTLTLFTILKDLLAVDWFTALAAYLGEPIVRFYVIVVTMHVIGLLYYRNRKALQW